MPILKSLFLLAFVTYGGFILAQETAYPEGGENIFVQGDHYLEEGCWADSECTVEVEGEVFHNHSLCWGEDYHVRVYSSPENAKLGKFECD